MPGRKGKLPFCGLVWGTRACTNELDSPDSSDAPAASALIANVPNAPACAAPAPAAAASARGGRERGRGHAADRGRRAGLALQVRARRGRVRGQARHELLHHVGHACAPAARRVASRRKASARLGAAARNGGCRREC